MNVGQHAVHPGNPVPTWNSPQGWQVHYTDAAAGASDESGRSSAIYLPIVRSLVCITPQIYISRFIAIMSRGCRTTSVISLWFFAPLSCHENGHLHTSFNIPVAPAPIALNTNAVPLSKWRQINHKFAF